MSTKPEALRLADAIDPLTRQSLDNLTCSVAAAELRRLHAQMVACEPYLKEGETPVERIQRDHRDNLALMSLLAREKAKKEALLAALHAMLSHTAMLDPSQGFDGFDHAAVNQARAAITKAEAA